MYALCKRMCVCVCVFACNCLSSTLFFYEYYSTEKKKILIDSDDSGYCVSNISASGDSSFREGNRFCFDGVS